MKENLLTIPRVKGGIIEIDGNFSPNSILFSAGVSLIRYKDRNCYYFEGKNNKVDYIRIPYSPDYPNPLKDNCILKVEYEVISVTGRLIVFSKNILIGNYGGYLFFEEPNHEYALANKMTTYGEGLIPLNPPILHSLNTEMTVEHILTDESVSLNVDSVEKSYLTSFTRLNNTYDFLLGNAFTTLDMVDPAAQNEYSSKPAQWVLYKFELKYL